MGLNVICNGDLAVLRWLSTTKNQLLILARFSMHFYEQQVNE